jgi:multiple sugar transport system ATP-binding protein
MSTSVTLENIGKSFGQVDVIRSIDLRIDPGEFAVFVGPSGCGKSTLLRMIAGLESINQGMLRLDDEVMNEVPAARRGVAMVFQSYALYPHMSVYQNLAFGLETARMPRAEIRERVGRAAQILRIEPLLQRKPKQLSGGQRQRVAIGRAIVREPRLFLFDEPLSNLDAELRVQMRVEIAKLHQSLGNTMIYVTHDQVEAMTMADKIVVLNGGRIEQVGSPLELYNAPRNMFVAGFIGSPKMNFLDARVLGVADAQTTLGLGDVRIAFPRLLGKEGEKLTLGIRPEHLDLAEGQGRLKLLEVEVNLLEHLGSQTHIHATASDGQAVVALLDGQRQLAPGDKAELFVDPARSHVFAADGSAI